MLRAVPSPALSKGEKLPGLRSVLWLGSHFPPASGALGLGLLWGLFGVWPGLTVHGLGDVSLTRAGEGRRRIQMWLGGRWGFQARVSSAGQAPVALGGKGTPVPLLPSFLSSRWGTDFLVASHSLGGALQAQSLFGLCVSPSHCPGAMVPGEATACFPLGPHSLLAPLLPSSGPPSLSQHLQQMRASQIPASATSHHHPSSADLPSPPGSLSGPLTEWLTHARATSWPPAQRSTGCE